MKLVKNKTLKKDPSKTRQDSKDSPLRYPMNVHMTDTHERRIGWLYYENYQICKEYISAQLLYSIAKLKYRAKEIDHINLTEYKAIKDALVIWQEVNFYGQEYRDMWFNSFQDSYKYHYVGDEEEEEEEEEE
jgi:hypothetical protein